MGVADGGAGNIFLPDCPIGTTDREFYVATTTPATSAVIYTPFTQPETRPDCNTATMVAVPVSQFDFIEEMHCPSNLSSSGVISVHHTKYQLAQGIFTGLFEVYEDSVNGGDTEFLLDLLDDPLVSSFELRNALLLASPRVTDQVMLEAIRHDPAMNPWHLAQVLLANSPLTRSVLNELSRSEVDPYYQELVDDGQHGGMTNTTLMEMELAHFSGKMESARADYIRQAYRQDSTGAWNDSIVHYLSDNASDEQLKLLMSYYIKRQQFQEAEDLLDQAATMRWSTDYVDIMTVLIDAMQNPTGADSIIAQEESLLLAIASGKSRDAHLARSILHAYGLVKNEMEIVLPGSQQKSLFKDKKEKATSRKPIASVHPNPAKDAAYLTWRLPEGLPSDQVDLVVYNTQGLPVLSNSINTEVGIQEINTTNWSTGLYIFQLKHQERVLHSGRFEIIR